MKVPTQMKKILLVLAVGVGLLSGCASMAGRNEVRQSASIVNYLYPRATQAPQLIEQVTTLRPPVRVGLAFVPTDPRRASLPESERMKLQERVRAAFAQHETVGVIEIIPTQYVQPGGGFDNMQRLATMFNVDLMAMVSYDQVRFNDGNSLSFLYWTIIGAYVVNGNQYDIRTMLDVSVFDVATRKLLFRAPGTSQIDGTGNLANYSERARAAQLEGYQKAAENLIPGLHGALEKFRARIKADGSVRVVPRATGP